MYLDMYIMCVSPVYLSAVHPFMMFFIVQVPFLSLSLYVRACFTPVRHSQLAAKIYTTAHAVVPKGVDSQHKKAPPHF
jgi:hypothetical protein